MDHRCVEPMELAALPVLPADDRRRLEAAACPRCDSLLREMAAFLEGDGGPPDDERDRAERHLAGVLAAALAEPNARSGEEPATLRARGEGHRRSSRGRKRGWGWGLGLAAAAAGVMFIVAREPLAPSGPSGVLRGGARTAELTATVAAGDQEGQWLLSWPAVVGADRYLVELFSTRLDTLAVYGPLTEPAVVVEAALLRGASDGRPASAGLLYRVKALGATGQVAVSRLSGLTLP